MNAPLCPLVLSLLAAAPQRPHEVAGAFEGGFPAALTALGRLQRAGLIRRRGPRYQLTHRGARELALQRRLWAIAL